MIAAVAVALLSAGMGARAQDAPEAASPSASAPTPETRRPQAGAPGTSAALSPVQITGSRLPRSESEGPTPVRIITREQINESGASRVVDVLSRLPEVSLAVTQTSFQAVDGQSTVALRGLPLGSTLVLINGRRVQSVTGAQIQSTAFFNLNLIPLEAVERIEVSPTGSSAVYGGDALAGVVNIILKKEFTGVQGSLRYGHASGTDRWDGSLASGWQTEKAS
ncbi:MAG TPA: TonB-dependent receptor plug domain-containing protein, partial [Caldimonas sp.]|nr:TonB-dependent receptor plug domain-containing protein [Caldimonas sp.]